MFTVLMSPAVKYYYIFAVAIAFPVVRVFGRAGLRRDYAALLAIPMVGLTCCLAALTFSRWNREEK